MIKPIIKFKNSLTENKSALPLCDLTLLILTVTLAIFGTVMVFSAGYAYAYARYDDGLYFIKRQAVWLTLGLITMTVSSRINPSYYKKITPALYALTLFLLMLVLIVGFVGNGAKRWISIGPLTIQPSEIAKLTIVMMLSYYFSKHGDLALDNKKRSLIFKYGTLYPILIMLVPIILVMLQKHLSCIIILGIIGMLMIVSAGVRLRYIGAFLGIGLIGVSYIAFFTDYTKQRITVWQNPEAYKLTGGWQRRIHYYNIGCRWHRRLH